ncbi:MAG: GNAT family N-acetyltransferase [Bacteroidia bacterium]|jgi:ElaA protein|nr:GNAT family N-acetyltransferase [Bacteroidia bacterium]
MNTPGLVWQCKPFNTLQAAELYKLLQLRAAVFVVEQNCPYLDPDDKDILSLHVWCSRGNDMLACARILPGGVSYHEVSIGRVATSAAARGTGLGRELMQYCLKQIVHTFGHVPVRIGAQCYLEKFYNEFGFERVGEDYLEDDIPHVEMLLLDFK